MAVRTDSLYSEFLDWITHFSHQLADTTVLKFSLTLEMPSYARGRLEQIAAHKKTHVEFLSTALGDNTTLPCEYSLYVYHLPDFHDRFHSLLI